MMSCMYFDSWVSCIWVLMTCVNGCASILELGIALSLNHMRTGMQGSPLTCEAAVGHDRSRENEMEQ